MFIVVIPEQPVNAELPMLVSELGRVMDVMPEQSKKALLPIAVTVCGIVTAPVFPAGHNSSVVLLALYRIPFSDL